MSMTERPVGTALKTMLVNNEPFQYAHLIKFERPSRPDSLSGLVSTKYNRYTYLTDASVNVIFDDGSTDLSGTPNLSQTYLANKVLSVGAIQEQTKATTSTTSLVLDGNSLGADITSKIAIAFVGPDLVTGASLWDITYEAPITLDDILAEGFREGDKVTVKGASNLGVSTNGITVNINSFRDSNVLRVSKIDEDLTEVASESTQLKLASEEIISILLNKQASDYASFINREVYIYRGYFQNGVIVGAPSCIFRGIISGVSFEDSENAIKVNWSLSSHWSDFAQVKGRITSDSAHRALDANGAPQVSSALKPIYAYDKGFIHAETSIHMLSKYVVQVPDYKTKSKKGFLGIGASVKTKKFYRPEDRFTNLDFQIQAKAIPLIYGVRKADSIPVFADTLSTNSAEVYMASVISEGEIGGIYDVYIDGNSLICNDKSDYDARSKQTSDNTVQLVCRGNSSQGDVLGGETITGGTVQYYGPTGEQISISQDIINNFIAQWGGRGYNLPTTTPPSYTSNYGLVDGDTLRLTQPSSIVLDVFTGKAGQKASAQLSSLALAKKFKIQNAYWTGGDTYEYWGPNHRLLDTAYVVGKFIIADGDTTIPEISFVVRGKVIDCYNYDYSFLHDIKQSTESADNFLLGDTVSLYYKTGTNYDGTETLLNANVQIIDKWTFYNPDGSQNTRFRFSTPPSLVYDATTGNPSIKKFYMKKGANIWTMLAHNYSILESTIASPIVSSIESVTATSDGYVSFNYPSSASTSGPSMVVSSDPDNSSALFQLVTYNGLTYDNITGSSTFPYAIMAGTASTTAFACQYTSSAYGTEASGALTRYPTSLYLASKNTIKVPSTSSVDDYYKNYMIEVTRYNSTTGKSLIQTATILGYNGATKIATIDGIWDVIPTIGDKIRIFPKYADSRVSINPAIQSLDYITSKTYGRGLDPYKDLDLPSWLETARKCDSRSDVSVGCNSSPTVGIKYKYPSSGNIIWQGTVLDVTPGTLANQIVTFKDVIGKLTNKWNSWKTWKINEIVYADSRVYQVTDATAANTITAKAAAPSHITGTVNGFLYISSLTLTRVDTTGSLTIPTASGNPVFNEKDGKKISGYSIYDCDDINYWKASGWDEHAQRYATRNQCNITLDTAQPLFDNMNGLLEHFNGILRYTAGKYYLDTEEAAGDIATTDVRTITIDDIIGKIQLTDEGTRSAFNSLTAAFADPANKFEPRNVSFFNSDYLKADRNVPKKGNLSIPGITNYYNTRLLADSFLNKSRFGLTISMTLRPSGFLLLAGTVIQVIYPRYDWVSPGKKFRIESVNYQPDGMVDIVAKEYDDSFYSLSNVKKVAGTGATTVPTTSTPGSPTNLIITSADTLDELLNGVELSWDNDPSINSSSNASTEIYGSLSPHLYITVTNIDGTTDILTSSYAHGLVPGMPIYPATDYTPSSTEIDKSKKYYVLDTPTSTTFTLSSTKNGTTPMNLTAGSGLSLQIRTATLLSTVPVPIRSYVDTIVNEGTGRVEKYYWVRHKVNRA